MEFFLYLISLYINVTPNRTVAGMQADKLDGCLPAGCDILGYDRKGIFALGLHYPKWSCLFEHSAPILENYLMHKRDAMKKETGEDR